MKNLGLSFDPEHLARDIMDLLIEKATDSNGMLIKEIDVLTGDVVNPSPNDDELGDYVQSFAWLGKYLNAPRYVDWSINQIKKAFALFVKDINYGKTWDVSAADRIFGPVYTFFVTQDHSIAGYVDRYFSLLFELAVTQDGLIRTKVNKSYPFLNWPVADPMTAGNHLELLSQLYLRTRKEPYLDMARHLARPWQDNDEFRSYGMFLRKSIGKFGRVATRIKDFLVENPLLGRHLSGYPSYWPRITKQNTHLLFGLLRYYEAVDNFNMKSILDGFFKTVTSKMRHPSGIYYLIFDVRKGKAFHPEILSTIALIELAAEAYKIFEDPSYLILARDAAESILKIRNNKGLIPQFPTLGSEERSKRLSQNSLSRVYNLDPHVDFIVNLLKIYECTYDQRILEMAIELIESVINHFRYGKAFAEILIDGEPVAVVRTKYLGLLLKLFIVCIAVQTGMSILTDPDLSIVCADR